MESLLLKLLNLLQKQTILLQELLSYLEKEQQCIINLSIDKLYEITKLKETNILKMKLLKESVHDVLDQLAPMIDVQRGKLSLSQLVERIPYDQFRPKLREAYGAVLSLTKLIETRNQENKNFIQESLSYINDSISMLINSLLGLRSYHKDGNRKLSSVSSLLSREV